MAPVRRGDDPSVLYVGPEADRTRDVERALSDRLTCDVTGVTGAAAARDAIGQIGADCVVSAHALPDDDGLELLQFVREERPALPFVLFPERGSETLASRAIAADVSDYVPASEPPDAAAAGAPATEPLDRLAERVREHLPGQSDRETDRRYRTLVDNLPGIVYRSRTDASWPFESVAGECEATTGYTASELRTDVDWEYDVLYPEDRAPVREMVEDAIDADEPFEVTYRIRTADGEVRWLWERGREVEPGVLEGFITDVTEQKERDRELQETNERLGAIIEASPDAIVAIDLDGRVELWNPAAERIFGWSESEVLGEPLPFVPDDRAEEHEEFWRQLESGEPVVGVETERVREDGREIAVNLSVAPMHDADGEIVGCMGVIQDVTDRKEREREFRETNDRLGAVIDASPAAIVAVDFDDGVELWNPAAERIFGWSESEVLGEPLPFVDEDHRAEFDRIRAQLKAGEPVAGVETERVTKDGREISVNLSIAPLSDADGEVTGAMAAIQDVSDRKQRERELQRTRELLTEAERLADVGAWEWDVRTDEVTWTRGTRRLFEVSDAYEPTLESAIEFYHPEDRETLRDLLEECRETGRFDDATLRIITAGGRERWVRTQGRAIEVDGETRRVRGTVQDITERKHRDHQVAVLDRVLRHNLRTDVGEIVDRAETIAEHGDGPAADSASAIASRANELLTLANKHREVAKLLSEPQTVHEYDVPAMIERVVEQMRETYPGAELSASLPPPVRVVTTSEIEEAVAELVENGVRHSDAETPAVEVTAEVEDDVVELRVADNGPGIPEEERRTIRSADDVDPLDHGSGMGLWLAKWTVSRAGGTMSFESSDPSGTVVRLRLPRTPVEPEPRATDAEREHSEHGA